MTNKVLFPGSFDPLTNGHLDLIERSSQIFDEVIVLIATNTTKDYLFSVEERVILIEEAVAHLDNVTVETLVDGLVADYYRAVGATGVVRGMRNSLDFEYESSIAAINQKQEERFETVCLFAKEKYRYLSSSLIKEIAHFKGDISEMVPANIAEAMEEKY